MSMTVGTTMKPLGALLASLVYILSADRLSPFAAAYTFKGSKQKKIKIGLLTGSLPWTYGPYQTQMHQLSLLLSKGGDATGNGDEYDINWLSHGLDIPPGVYRTFDELRPLVPLLNPPPSNFPIDHITYLGFPTGHFRASDMNRIAKGYELDLVVCLVDAEKITPDVPFELPVVAWLPLHSKTVRKTSVPYWVLRNFHGIAGLSPSATAAIEEAVGTEIDLDARILKKIAGTAQIEFIPHVIDRKELLSLADVGLKMLKRHSVAHADSKLTGSPLIDRGQESTLEAGGPLSLFGEARKDDFIVLLSGGNYEDMDRKGWDTSFQAFVNFYNTFEDPSEIHLLVHSIESFIVAADANRDADPPPALLPQGRMLHLLLHEYGLPRDAYTIDIARHAPEVAAAYKARANVCLHPSKVEGFGLIVMECQALGTPVITTNYTAMGDYTKLGRAVSPRQTIRHKGIYYEMALPDVVGITDALRELYEEHLAIKRGDKTAASRREDEVAKCQDWIDTTFSAAKVGNAFKSLLPRAKEEFLRRSNAKNELRRSSAPPSGGAFKISSGYYATVVDWDSPWTLLAPDGLKLINPQALHQKCWAMLLSEKLQHSGGILVLPAVYEDGKSVPVQTENQSLHDDCPILVRTHLLAGIQSVASRRQSLAAMAINLANGMNLLPEGLAIVEKQRSRSREGRKAMNSEL
eukprot:TRINITY_DN33952_c0_g1_i1.p1 TRINITY_DN33952_c0_g1~~TRINITY_DN33952_c0_g1_i1.p1  ORF type:complete len:692 (+),score=38.45 TRINITY_DN33952_c0_g1_i1:10-2085(+)